MKAYVDRCFLNHCLALARLARVRGPVVDRIARGAELWRALLKWEARGARLALRLCNGPEFQPGEVERETARITDGVSAVLNGAPLHGLFVNGDPRGYAVKIEARRYPVDPRSGGSGVVVARGWPVGMLTDWGGYGILAPDFAGRS